MTTYEHVRKIVADQMGVAVEEISAETEFKNPAEEVLLDSPEEQVAGEEEYKFIKYLEADSLDIMEIILSIENEFSNDKDKITIPDAEIEKMISVQDVVNYLDSLTTM